jgi:hypothetical protein
MGKLAETLYKLRKWEMLSNSKLLLIRIILCFDGEPSFIYNLRAYDSMVLEFPREELVIGALETL